MGASGSMGIRPESEADHDAVRRTVTSAFGSDAEALLVDRIRASPECVPEMALVAVVDDEVVGHVMISDAVLQHVSGERRISMLSPLAVSPERQREGIGSALVRAALAAADERREPLVVLEGSPGYYGRLGFEPAARYGIALPLPDWAPPEAAQVIRLSAFEPDDRSLRGTVVYPAAFTSLH